MYYLQVRILLQDGLEESNWRRPEKVSEFATSNPCPERIDNRDYNHDREFNAKGFNFLSTEQYNLCGVEYSRNLEGWYPDQDRPQQ